MCGGLLLLGVPTCLRACEGGTPGRRRVGIRSSELGFAYHTSTLCMLCRKVGSQARNYSLLRQSKAVPTGSVRGWLPSSVLEELLLTDGWGPFSLDLRVENAWGSPGRRKESYLTVRRGTLSWGVGYWLLPGVFTRSPGPSWGLGGAP